MKRFDVVGLGYCAIDYLGVVDEYPALDEKVGLRDFSIQGGGITATAMVAVARLGGRASYIGKVGDDDFGRQIISGLQDEKVDASRVVVQPGAASQFSFVVVHRETGKRTIFAHSGGTKLEPEDVRREDVLAGKVLQVDAHHFRAAVQAASWANDAGIPVVMDAGSLREGSRQLVQHVDCLIASELFAQQFAEEDDPVAAGHRFIEASRGVRSLTAVTLNERGCVYVTGDGIAHQPAFSVDTVDTTGAGDVFHGAFSFGLARGWEYPQIIEFASAVAAIKCTQLGGRAGIPDFAQTIEFLQARSDSAFWSSVRLTQEVD